MTDPERPGQPEEPGRPEAEPLTPAQEERVRRLLAEARHDEPIPPDVATRLDAVLADLSAEPRADHPAEAPAGDQQSGAPVVDLAARRRRRRMTQVLVAAVAVTVVGVAGPQLVGGAGDMMGATSSNDSAAGGDADEESAPQAEDAPADSGADSGSDSGPDSGTDGELSGSGGERSAAAKAAVTLTSETFLRKVARLQPQAQPTGAPEAQHDLVDGVFDLKTCRGDAQWGPGGVVPVIYDDALGVLVYRAPEDDEQLVELYLCGDTDPLRTAVLPAP